jgi:hypothetical protein
VQGFVLTLVHGLPFCIEVSVTASSEKEEEEQQSAKIEDVPVIHQSPQMAPTESQTITSSYVSPPPPPPQTMPEPEPEICNDSIDNDVDTLNDMSDTDCNPSQIQQQQQQVTLQQEPVIVSSPEICDDDLDNDLDSKMDSSDEECSSIASSMSSVPLPRQAQSVAGEQIEENEDEDKELESDEGSEESASHEENNNDENEDEDEDEE